MTKLLFDCRAIFDSGIGSYTREVLIRLTKYASVTVIVSESDIENFRKLDISVESTIVVKFGRFSWRNVLFIKRHLSDKDFFFSPTFLMFYDRKKMLVTIHDVCLLDCRSFFSIKAVASFSILVALNVFFSRHVFTISEFSKNRILHFFKGLNEDRVSVFYNGRKSFFHEIDLLDSEEIINRLSLRKNEYYISVGNIKPHKNFRNLCEYWETRKVEKPLVIVGSSEGLRTKEVLSSFHNVIFTGYVTDEDLAFLYSNALGFIYPSFYEGFGLPLLEAMEFGLPIAASDIPVFHELAGDLIYYFDPHDFENLELFLSKVKVDLNYHEVLSKFSWDDTVENILKVIDSEGSPSK